LKDEVSLFQPGPQACLSDTLADRARIVDVV
jgi:hypothetical protein